MTLGILWPFIEYYHQGNNVPYPVNCLYIDMVRHKMLYFNLQYMGQSSNFRTLTNTLSGWLWVNCVKAKYLKFHTFLVQAVLIWKTTTKVDSESSILSPIFTFPVGQRPLVAILIVTTAKEEKQYKEQQVQKKVRDGWLGQTSTRLWLRRSLGNHDVFLNLTELQVYVNSFRFSMWSLRLPLAVWATGKLTWQTTHCVSICLSELPTNWYKNSY